MFKSYIASPIYCALGNHDAAPDNLDAPQALDGNGPLGRQFSWNYDVAADEAALHYSAYSVRHPLGLRVIAINMYYKANYYAFVHAANVFFSHILEDQAFVYYRNNGTVQTADSAVASAWVGPPLTPLTNLNSIFRLYEVDTGSWDIFDAYTFYADVDSFAHLDGSRPVFRLEYSTRAAYGPAAGWPADAPFNATFWHRVTEAMEADRSPQGFASVQSPYSGTNV